jgi:hypothetical protein
MLQSVHVFEAQVLRKSLGSEFEIAWGYSILDNPRRTALRIPSRGFLHWSVARAGPGARGATIMGPASANRHICRRRHLERDK